MAGSHSAWPWVKRSRTCSSAVPSWSRPGDSPRTRRQRRLGRWKRRSRGGLGRRAICTQMTRRLWRGVRFDMVWQAQILVNLGIWILICPSPMTRGGQSGMVWYITSHLWFKWPRFGRHTHALPQYHSFAPITGHLYMMEMIQMIQYWLHLVAIVSIVLCFLDALSSLCLIAQGLLAFSSKWCQHIRFGKSHRSQVISKLFPLNIHIYHQHSRGSSHVCRPSSSTSPFGPTPSSGPFREDRPPNTSVPCPTGPGVTPRGSWWITSVAGTPMSGGYGWMSSCYWATVYSLRHTKAIVGWELQLPRITPWVLRCFCRYHSLPSSLSWTYFSTYISITPDRDGRVGPDPRLRCSLEHGLPGHVPRPAVSWPDRGGVVAVGRHADLVDALWQGNGTATRQLWCGGRWGTNMEQLWKNGVWMSLDVFWFGLSLEKIEMWVGV